MITGRFLLSFLSTQLKQSILPKKPMFWLSLLFWLVLIAPAQAALELRVAIEEGVNQVKIGSSTKAVVRDATGKSLGEIAAMNAFYAQPNEGGVALDRWRSGALWIEPTGEGYVWIGDKWYRGRTLVIPTEKGLTAINYVDLEEYLYSVVGAEVFSNWPQEALKAQAVAARTYALYQRQTRGNKLYDLGDTIDWQVYKGVETESMPLYSAVSSTAGQVMTHKGKLILAAFHACSGGHTDNVEDVWTNPLPYLRGVPDFDQNIPDCQWTRTLSREELSRRLKGVGNVQSLIPERTSPHGTIITMKVVGDAGTRIMKGGELLQELNLKSARFTVTSEAGKTDDPAFRLEGRGFGHGVGLSQWGAYGMAKQGYKYQQIVQYYYQGATLAKIKVK